MVAITLRIVGIALTVLQTGAFVLLSTALLLIVLPLLAATLSGILLTALVESNKSNRQLEQLLQGKQVYILFAPESETPFFRQNVASLAALPDRAVIVVSPYWISGKGLGKSAFYCTFRKASQNLYLVRRYYFFKLKKNVLSDKPTAYLY